MRGAWLPAFVLLLASACATAPPAAPTPPAAPAQPAPAPAAKERTAVGGALNPQMVADYVLAQAPTVRACYHGEIEQKRDVSGKLLIRWTIDETGGTRGIVVQLNTMQDSAVADCLQAAIRGWRFAKPPGGPVNVSFPFTYQAVEGAPPPREGPAVPKTAI